MAIDLSFLDSYQEDFSPQTASSLPLLENIPDGSYDCTFISAIVTETKTQKQPILKCMVRFDSLDQTAEKAYFLANQENVNRLAGDLKTMGFEADKWKKNCKLSEEISKAVSQLPGLRFKGTKKTSPPNQSGKVYHNLYINAALEPSPDMKQLRADNETLAAANGKADSIPF